MDQAPKMLDPTIHIMQPILYYLAHEKNKKIKENTYTKI